MVQVNLEGSLQVRRKTGNRVYKAYFVLFADGVMLREFKTNGARDGKFSVNFRELLAVLGKSGPAGLEGCIPEGGSWILLHLTPSDEERTLTVSLALPNGKASLTIRGGIDVSFIKLCPSCDYRAFLELSSARARASSQ